MPVIKENLTPINHRAGGCTPKWIVVHYFGALGSAASVAEWFKNPQARASAHYAVDEGDIIYRCVKDTDVAWHCGDGTLHPECRNWNSIGVELRPGKVNRKRVGAYDTDWFFEKKVLDNAEWLIHKLMEEHNIPADHIIRHYDVSGKFCPRPFVGTDMNVDGKEGAVERILKDGTNYVKVRDIAAALGLKVSNKGNIAVLDSK